MELVFFQWKIFNYLTIFHPSRTPRRELRSPASHEKCLSSPPHPGQYTSIARSPPGCSPAPTRCVVRKWCSPSSAQRCVSWIPWTPGSRRRASAVIARLFVRIPPANSMRVKRRFTTKAVRMFSSLRGMGAVPEVTVRVPGMIYCRLIDSHRRQVHHFPLHQGPVDGKRCSREGLSSSGEGP